VIDTVTTLRGRDDVCGPVNRTSQPEADRVVIPAAHQRQNDNPQERRGG